jgi:hypothetical protein
MYENLTCRERSNRRVDHVGCVCGGRGPDAEPLWELPRGTTIARLTSALEEAKKGLEKIADLWDAPVHRRVETPTMAESTLNRIKELTEEGK